MVKQQRDQPNPHQSHDTIVTFLSELVSKHVVMGSFFSLAEYVNRH
jgi:hypothetical protein